MSGIGFLGDRYLFGFLIVLVSLSNFLLVSVGNTPYSISVGFQGSAPTISVDNTGGCQLYLSKDSLNASVTTAKSSEINVLVPGEEPDGDWVSSYLFGVLFCDSIGVHMFG